MNFGFGVRERSPDDRKANDLVSSIPDLRAGTRGLNPKLPFAASLAAFRHQTDCFNWRETRRAMLLYLPGQLNGCRPFSSPFASVEVILCFGLPSQQPILDHVKQQLLNSFLQRHRLFGAQQLGRHGDFPSPDNMARLCIPELQPQS